MDVGRKEILEKIGLAVRNAALNGDPIALLEALSQENVLAGLIRSMHGRWHSIDEDDLADKRVSAVHRCSPFERCATDLGRVEIVSDV